MSDLNFQNRVMTGAKFTDVDVENAVFDDVNLKGVRFNNVNMEGAVFTDINLKDASITESCIEGLMVWGQNVQDLIQKANEAGKSESSLSKSMPVEEFVGQAHGNLDRIKELLELHPTLLNAAWDWGGGDWETALGAASHMGRRDIAEFLLSKGARMDIFAAAMLGELEIVKSILSAQPEALQSPGPHGIPLIAHALKGGEEAKFVAEYLELLG